MQPLFTDFLSRCAAEHTRAVEKYPQELWDTLPKWRMGWALISEVWELFLALWRKDLHGSHGIVVEAAQCAGLAGRIACEMVRRSEK